MEMSPHSFLNQDDYSNFHTLIQELHSPTQNINTSSSTPDLDNGTTIKESIGDDFDAVDTPFKFLSNILFSSDEFEEKPDTTNFQFPQTPPNSVLDFTFKQNPSQITEISDHDSRKLMKNARKFDSISSSITDGDGGGGSGGGGGGQRRLWVKDRSKAWWEQYGNDDCPDEEFIKAFRMSKATFNFICSELDFAVTKKDTMLRLAIPVRQRVAVCIYRLATGEALRLISKRFGLGISTCHKIVLDVCTAIKDVLMPKFVVCPEENKLMEVKKDFEGISGIPNIGGLIYTTHIPINAPKVNAGAYFNKGYTEINQKPSYSTTVQGVVDSRGIFITICIGLPGAMSPNKILEKSVLFQKGSNGLLKDIWIVGNSCYPLMDWILTPYTDQNLTLSKHFFNEKVNVLQDMAKEAFVKLKGRWTLLQKRTEIKLQDLQVVIGACCVLHNICEMRNEKMETDLRIDLFDDEIVAENAVRSVNALHARDKIAHYILRHK